LTHFFFTRRPYIAYRTSGCGRGPFALRPRSGRRRRSRNGLIPDRPTTRYWLLRGCGSLFRLSHPVGGSGRSLRLCLRPLWRGCRLLWRGCRLLYRRSLDPPESLFLLLALYRRLRGCRGFSRGWSGGLGRSLHCRSRCLFARGAFLGGCGPRCGWNGRSPGGGACCGWPAPTGYGGLACRRTARKISPAYGASVGPVRICSPAVRAGHCH
jgi:hypothetical protein